FGVILGTGTGGGLAVDGRAIIGANAIGGEGGHNPLPWPGGGERPGAACYCGKRGCIETFLSGPGLAADYHRRGGDRVRREDVLPRAGAGAPPATHTPGAWGRAPRGARERGVGREAGEVAGDDRQRRRSRRGRRRRRALTHLAAVRARA